MKFLSWHLICQYPFTSLGGGKQCESEVCHPRTQINEPRQLKALEPKLLDLGTNTVTVRPLEKNGLEAELCELLVLQTFGPWFISFRNGNHCQ